MAFASASSTDGAPMGEMNTTPLIDVMLVLLIMFILTIPIQMHATRIGLPGTGVANGAPAPSHRIDIDALGAVYWDGATVDAAGLSARLATAAASEAEIRLKPDAYARYEQVNQVLATVQRAGIERVGFVGNEAFAD